MNKRQWKKNRQKYCLKKWHSVKARKKWLKELFSPELAKIFYENLFKEHKEPDWQPLKRKIPFSNGFRKLGEYK